MTAISGWWSRFRNADAEGGEALPFLAAGPISLFLSLCAAIQREGNFDLAIASAVGIYLCFSLKRRGLFYSLAILFLGALAKHFFFLDSHLWQLGVECSVALGFVICSLSAEQLYSQEEAVEARMESQRSAICNLEEEASRKAEEALEEKMALQERLSELQKELDDAYSELSSLQILNDVIRKSSVKNEEAESRLAEKERRIGSLLQEIEALSQPSDGASESAALLEELNAARVEREQTSLINETLVRMHRAADRKARDLLAQNELLEDRIEALSQTQSEGEELIKAELQETRMQMANLIEQRTFAIESERRQWKEQISERDRTIALFQERIQALSETQALYFQLKKQFEEKNKVLHETRQALFRVETALQAAQIEQRWEEVEFPLFESMLASQVVILEEEKQTLASENAELSEIIGMLSKPSKSPPAKAKKKQKRSYTNPNK